MRKLSKEKLLEFLDEWFREAFVFDEEMEDDKQAYQQIRKLIEEKPLLPEKRALTIKEIIQKYPGQLETIIKNRLEEKLKKAGIINS